MVLGIVFSLLAAVSSGLEKILHRHVLADEDSLSYAFIFNVLSSIFFLPLFFIEFNLPTTNTAWILVIISSFLWTSVGYLGFKSYSLLDVSVKTPIGKSKLFFVLFLSVIFLKEALSVEKVIGTILIFVGIVLVVHNKRDGFRKFKHKGVLLTLSSAFLTSVVLLVDKYALNFFNPGMYSFMVYFFPAVLFFPFVVGRKSEMKSIFKRRFSATIGSVFLAAAYYYLLLRALKLEEASVVVPLVELGTLIAIFGGIKFLKEKEDIPRKILAAVVVIIGALLLSGKVF